MLGGGGGGVGRVAVGGCVVCGLCRDGLGALEGAGGAVA